MLSKSLIFIVLISFAFPTLGYELAKSFWLTPAYLVLLLSLVYNILLLRSSAWMLLVLWGLLTLHSSLAGGSLTDIGAITIFLACIWVFCLRSINYDFARKVLKIFWKINVLLLVIYYVFSFFEIDIFSEYLGAAKVYHNIYLYTYRPQLFFPEPSYLGYYFAISTVYLEKRISFNLVTIFCLILTGSLGGILLYSIISVFNLSLLKKTGFILTVCLFFIMFDTDLALRLWKTYNALLTGDLGSSEGSRINSIFIAVKFIQQADLFELFFGIAWPDTANWVKDAFPGVSMFSSVSRGHVDNLLVSLLLKAGLVGLLLIFTIVSQTVKGVYSRLNAIIGFIILACFSGMILYQFYWIIICLYVKKSSFIYKEGYK